MTADNIRMGIVGLGMMGRHHARILAKLRGVDFVGAVDPNGDPEGVLRSGELYSDVDQLLAMKVDAVVVAVPTVDHEPIALHLASNGINCLIEKPVAADVDTARRIVASFHDRGLIGAVGHVERFNPALQEMERRLREGQLGRVFSVATERVGPFPDRVRDIGVVKDLATHDIDLVRWLGHAEFDVVWGQTAHKMGRPNEDLVAAVGRLTNGIVVSMTVNWLTPTKRRLVTLLGERGALVADMISTDLTYFTNAEVATEWDAVAQLRGVSEGDVIRYALRKREPLLVELENFRDAVLGRPTAHIIGLEDGIEVIRVAETILASAAKGEILTVGRS